MQQRYSTRAEMEREILEHRAHKVQLKERKMPDAERKNSFEEGLARVEAQLKAVKPKLVQAKQRHEPPGKCRPHAV